VSRDSEIADDLIRTKRHMDRHGVVYRKMRGLTGGVCVRRAMMDVLPHGRWRRAERHMDRRIGAQGKAPVIDLGDGIGPVVFGLVGAHDCKTIDTRAELQREAERLRGGSSRRGVTHKQRRAKAEETARKLPRAASREQGKSRASIGRVAAAVGLVVAVPMIIGVASTVITAVVTVLFWLLITAIVLMIVVPSYHVCRDQDWSDVRSRCDAMQQRLAARRTLRAQVEQKRQPIALSPMADEDVQAWIEKGLRDRRLDGYQPEPVRKVK
jgi:hypothetical protein